MGKSQVGNAAYPPVVLLKALLLQKWFGIRSDPALENQINDRVSFKVFIGLPLGDASPDHSVISRFRNRVGSKVMELVHVNLLRQLQKKGFSIDAGLAVDARLVRSVSGFKAAGLKGNGTPTSLGSESTTSHFLVYYPGGFS